MQTGWVNHHGNVYYYDKEGKMCHGWSEIEGTFYLIDEWNGIHKPGWRKENDKIYYYAKKEVFICTRLLRALKY